MKNLPNIFSRLRSSSGAQSHANIVHPGRDWFIGLCFAAVVIIGGSAMSGVLFLRYSTIDIGRSEATVKLPRYNELQVSEALAAYEARRTVYQAILERRMSVVPDTVPAPATSTPAVREPVVATSTPSEVVPDSGGVLNFE